MGEIDLDVENFHPYALSMLKSSKSMNKMMKGFVRKSNFGANEGSSIKSDTKFDDSKSITTTGVTTTGVKKSLSVDSVKTGFSTPPLSRASTKSKFAAFLESSIQEEPQLTRMASFRSTHSSTSEIQADKKDEGSTIYDALPHVPASTLADQESDLLSPSRSQVKSRGAAAERTRLGGIPSSPAQMDINGYLIPRNAMQDSMVHVFRQQEVEHRKSPIKVGEQAFEDSIGGGSQSTYQLNPKDTFEYKYKDITNQWRIKNPEKLQEARDKLEKTTSISLIHSNTESSQESFLKLTSQSKINSLVSIEDDYALKWKKMKEKRDHEIKSELKLEKRKEMRHLLQRIAINSDRDEIQRLNHFQKYEKQKLIQDKKVDYEGRRKQHELILTKRLEKNLQNKVKQAKTLKKTLKEALNISREVIQRDTDSKLQYFRENHIANNFQTTNSMISTDSLTSGIVDDNSSTIIHFPPDIMTRLKTAKRYLHFLFV
jgi:hypothetical protein